MALESESWTREQKNVVTASALGWTLDAFDYFLFVFVWMDMANIPRSYKSNTA